MSGIRKCDLLVIGGGPAGLAAATQAAALGSDVLLLDEQPAPGGQIYRAITSTPLRNKQILGADYWHGQTLVDAFRSSGSNYEPRSTVWAMHPLGGAERGFEIAYSNDNVSSIVHARHVVLASGAQERPFPIAGWTLPGVITAGAAQILLKSAGVVPAERTLLAGCGPLLYLIAWQYLNAGVKVDALLDTTPRGRMLHALPYAMDFLRSAYLVKGLRLLRAVRASIPIIGHVTHLEACGSTKLERVRYAAGGGAQELAADQLLLHQGVVPNLNLSQAAGVPNRWNRKLHCWEPVVDEWGATAVPGLSIAGDGAGIAGALAAEHRGRIAALQASFELGRVDKQTRDQLACAPRKAHGRAVRGREFFDSLYQPPEAFRSPEGDTIVCRCEEVTARQVREVVAQGVRGPNQMKAFLRCGMGPCQGRFCSLTVSELIARESHQPPQAVGTYRLRFPTKPMTLGELASLPQTDASRAAVIRFKRPS